MESQTIDRFLGILRDGNYHSLAEIIDQTQINERRIRIVVAFLQKFRFIETARRGQIRLNTVTKKFLDKLDETDQESHYEEITA